MLGCFGAIMWRSAVAAGVSALPVLVLHVTGVVDMNAVHRVLVSWTGLAVATGVLVVIYLVRAFR
jgi:hypothetical protein